jgi:serine protease Do
LRHPLDLERALLGRQVGTPISVQTLRDGRTLALDLVLAEASAGPRDMDDRSWELFGLRLSPIPPQQFREHSSYYRGGLSITDVRPDSPAYREGIRRGDILVGIHRWQTVSLENVSYVLKREDLASYDPIKLWILRGNETFYGLLSVASHTTPPAR